VIAPAFDTPAPPASLKKPPAPPMIVPLFDRLAIVLAFDTPAPPVTAKPFPPLIAPRLVSVMIVPEFRTPAPPSAQTNFTSVPVPLSGARVKLDFE